MIEQDLPIFTLDTAIAIATEAHKNQRDRAGKPYIEHVTNVMNQLQGDQSKMVGILHDIVEDTSITLDDLRHMGCPPIVVEGVGLVTHPKDYNGTEEEYFDQINAIADSGNQLAIDAKWADLTSNSDKTRIPNPKERDLKRWEKYKKAKETLKPFVSRYLLEV